MNLITKALGGVVFFLAVWRGLDSSSGWLEVSQTMVVMGLIAIVFLIFAWKPWRISYWSVFSILVVYVVLKLVEPPLPGSLIGLYMGATILTVGVFLTIRDETLSEVKEAVIQFLVNPQGTLVMRLFFGLILVLTGLTVFSAAKPRVVPPIEIRSTPHSA